MRASIVRCGYQQVLSTDERDVAKYEKLVAKSEVVSETLLSAQMNISNYGIVDLAHFKESVEKQTRIFKEMATLGRTNRAIKALFWNKSNPESNAPLLNLVVQSIESNFIKLKEFNKRIASIVEDNSRRQLKLRLMHKTGKIPLELRKLTKVVELNSFHQDLSVEVKRISLFLNYLYKCLRLLLYMISDAGVASGRGRLFFEKDYDIIYISTLLITGTFGNEIEYDGSFDTLCKDKYFTSTITRVLLPAESALVKIKTMSVLIMTEFCDMVNIDTGSGSKVRLQFEDLFLRWKNVNGEQG